MVKFITVFHPLNHLGDIMHRATTLVLASLFLLVGSVAAQTTEFIFNPLRTGELNDPFPVYSHNGARGLSGPFDMDHDGKLEFLVAQHDAAGGTVHVIENVGLNTWELVYSTALIDSSSSSRNARYAYSGDLDGDGRGEIIFAAGNGYNTTTNPNYVMGLYVFEWDGVPGSDNYGTAPATIGDFYALDGLGQPSSYLDAQNFRVGDVDGDGQDEVLLAANGSGGTWDVFYVLSVNGDFETNGAGTTFETWVIEARDAPRTRNIGGGSPYGVQFGDFNGDGFGDINWHSWNSFNLFNATTDGANVYIHAADGNNVKASAGIGDHVALFGGTVVDIDGDGTDEVFYPNFYSGKITVVDYDKFENVLEMSADNVAFDAIPIGATGGATWGDVDDDGALEILVGGPGYSLAAREAGDPSHFIHVAEFLGGDPKDGANYGIYEIDTSSPLDTLGFHFIIRDSLGTMSSYHELAQSKQGSTTTGSDPVFTSGIVFLGDADDDGDMEIALSFQGVDDSLYVYDEVWNADSLRYDRTIRTRMENPTRAFVRIISMDGMAVSSEPNDLILPTDYILDQNYPNPFNPSTTIRFTLPLDKAVSVRIYDVSGRVVRTLIDHQFMYKGAHEITWNGETEAGVQAASGTYLYSLQYGNFRQTRTMVLLK